MDADAIEHAVTPHRGSPTALLRAVSPLASERAVDWSRQAARAVERGRLRLGESTYLGFGTSSEAEPPAAAIGMVRTDGRIGGDDRGKATLSSADLRSTTAQGPSLKKGAHI